MTEYDGELNYLDGYIPECGAKTERTPRHYKESSEPCWLAEDLRHHICMRDMEHPQPHRCSCDHEWQGR
jgi:hypothetical protein